MRNKDNKLPQRKKLRMEGYDYSSTGCYFVTIVTKERQCLFGDIVDGIMFYNNAGKAIDDAIRNIEVYDKYIMVTSYVVMPNHIHMIIMQTGSNLLSEVIRRFKSETTHIYIEGVKSKGWQPFDGKLWQRNYFEHIIRNERAYDYIAQYIFDNPSRWNKDSINPHHDNDTDEIMRHVLEL